MTDIRYVVIDTQTKRAIWATIEPEGKDNPNFIPHETGQIGQLWDGADFVDAEPTPLERNRERYTQIADIECTITPRRLREAALGVQESIDFIAAVDADIAAIRAGLEAE